MNHGRNMKFKFNIVMVADVGRRPGRQRQRIYDHKIFIVLKRIWEIMNFTVVRGLLP
jgi:hypothetical protein